MWVFDGFERFILPEFTFSIYNAVMEAWRIKLFVDGACPVCKQEMRWLRRLDKGRGHIIFEDISDPSFDAANFGLDNKQVILRMYGILPDGQVVQSMTAFRSAYSAVGFGWLLAPTGWPVLRPICDLCYLIFAKIRPRLNFKGNNKDSCTTGCRTDLDK